MIRDSNQTADFIGVIYSYEIAIDGIKVKMYTSLATRLCYFGHCTVV